MSQYKLVRFNLNGKDVEKMNKVVFRVFLPVLVFKQVYNSGMARINLYLLHPHSLKLVHFLPACFVIGCLLCLLGGIFFSWYCLLPLLLLIFVFFIDSWRLNKRIKVAFLSIVAAFIQLFAYGIGFIHAVFAALILKRPVKGMFVRNFYK